MNATEIIPPSRNDTYFGYCTIGDWVYFGIERVIFSYKTEVIRLSTCDVYQIEPFKLWSHVYTEPEGWTRVGIRKFTLQE